MIEVNHISFQYPGKTEFILKNISFQMHPGERIGLMGANGSGKTTFLQCLNGLLLPQAGEVLIDGLSTQSEKDLPEIRRRLGMVFQNSDDQMVATTLEREIAFGLENIGIPREQMKHRVLEALERFDLTNYKDVEPHLLSGGECQRLALASIWVMHPDYYILDEPTSLLDPLGREMILTFMVDEAKKNRGFLLVTQHPGEVKYLDRLVVFHKGQILVDEAPLSAFERIQNMPEANVPVPIEFQIADKLKEIGFEYPI